MSDKMNLNAEKFYLGIILLCLVVLFVFFTIVKIKKENNLYKIVFCNNLQKTELSCQADLNGNELILPYSFNCQFYGNLGVKIVDKNNNEMKIDDLKITKSMYFNFSISDNYIDSGYIKDIIIVPYHYFDVSENIVFSSKKYKTKKTIKISAVNINTLGNNHE